MELLVKVNDLIYDIVKSRFTCGIRHVGKLERPFGIGFLSRVLCMSSRISAISELREGEQLNASFEGDYGSEVLDFAVSRSRLGFMSCGPLVAPPFS